MTELCMRSKAHWGYDESFLNACADELRVTPEAIESDQVWRVAVDDGQIVGVYAVRAVDEEECELEALFVDPRRIGSGIGRHLVDDASRTARNLGYRRIVIQGDPNAEGFYVALGAVQIGERESMSIPGRTLPLFEIQVTADDRRIG